MVRARIVSFVLPAILAATMITVETPETDFEPAAVSTEQGLEPGMVFAQAPSGEHRRVRRRTRRRVRRRHERREDKSGFQLNTSFSGCIYALSEYRA